MRLVHCVGKRIPSWETLGCAASDIKYAVEGGAGEGLVRLGVICSRINELLGLSGEVCLEAGIEAFVRLLLGRRACSWRISR